MSGQKTADICLVFEKHSHIKQFLSTVGGRKVVSGLGTLGYEFTQGRRYFATTAIGTAHILNLLPAIRTHVRCDIFIRIGTCGVVRKDLNLGDYGLVISCTNKDILSERLLPDSNPTPSDALLRRLCGLPGIKEITAFTLDVVWQPLPKAGDSVDMETTALFCYANAHDLKAASISLFRDRGNEMLPRAKIEESISRIAMQVIQAMENIP
ncbi:MAG: hypothetical protein HKL90_02165 [Elusimicrobia bacterium]|nr:hypothetical protein [Elusimicrobiota bacterium]